MDAQAQFADGLMNNRNAAAALRRCSVTSLLATGSLLAFAVMAQAGSLTDTVRAALQTNPDIGVVKADRRAVDQELRLARSGYLPAVDLRAAAGPEYSDNNTTRARVTNGDGSQRLFRSEAQLSLTQMLFDGFATTSEIERQRARVNSAAFRVAEAAEFVALDAIEAHLNVLRNQEIVALNETNVAQHRRILSQVGDLEEGGRTDVADVRQAESRLARAEESLAISQGNLADARATFIRIVGESPADLSKSSPPAAVIPASSDDAAELASVSSPTVSIAGADVDVSSAELRGSRSGFYPRFDLELGADVGEDLDGVEGNNVGASALVVMRYNIFRGGGDIALEREAFHRVNEARANLQRARLAAEEEARLSYNAFETAKARTLALTSKAEAQRRTRDAYASQFEVGNRDLLDLLDAENELFIDRVNLTTAMVTEEFAVYRVLAVVGGLLDTLDVSRPREHISIYRTLDDAQTPEAVVSKSRQLEAPASEPRLLRSEEAGEPPASMLDITPETGAPAPADVSASALPSTSNQTAAVPEYDSFASFIAALGGDVEDAALPASEPVTAASAEIAGVEEATEVAAAVANEGPAEYDSLDSFFSAILGTGQSEVEPQVESTLAVDGQELTAQPSEGSAQSGAAVYDDLQSFLDAVLPQSGLSEEAEAVVEDVQASAEGAETEEPVFLLRKLSERFD